MLEKKLRERIANAKIGSTERDILKVVLGECQQKASGSKISDEVGFTIIKKLVKSNQETLSYMKDGDKRKDDLLEENTILQTLLPVYMTEQEIRDRLIKDSVVEQVKAAKNDGQAVGLAMGYLRKLNLSIEGDTVKKAVLQIRQ